MQDQYDYIFIDCPPSLGLLTINALACANSILIPIQCEFYALEGLSHLLKTYQAMKRNFNRYLEIEGVVLTMYDKRCDQTHNIESEIRLFLGDKVYSIKSECYRLASFNCIAETRQEFRSTALIYDNADLALKAPYYLGKTDEASRNQA